MAHFAYVRDGVVQRVHVLANPVVTDENGNEQESLGQEFLSGLHGGSPADYVQCSYSGSMRGIYPGVGDLWDGVEFSPAASPAP